MSFVSDFSDLLRSVCWCDLLSEQLPTGLFTQSCFNKDLWLLCLTFLIRDAAGYSGHTHTPQQCICALLAWFCFLTEKCILVSRVWPWPWWIHRHTVSLGLCVWLSVSQSSRMELVLYKECGGSGSVWGSTWISSVHCDCICTRLCAKCCCVYAVCSVEGAIKKSEQWGSGWGLASEIPALLRQGKAFKGSRALFYVALVHVKETWLINTALVHCVREGLVCL